LRGLPSAGGGSTGARMFLESGVAGLNSRGCRRHQGLTPTL